MRKLLSENRGSQRRCARLFRGATLTLMAGMALGQAPDVARVQAFALPQSSYLSAQTRAALARQRLWFEQTPASQCASLQESPPAQRAEIRHCLAEEYYRTPLYRAMRDHYAVDISTRTIGGVVSEVFTPSDGVPSRNRSRILVNLHGGGFLEGARSVGHLESIPIAAVAQVEVISVDYRQAPEA